ncbi:uncharacterized protein ARMOST_22630 [Armillaria ostoyae]|uniref:Uncharacterized protein n=1 Tax=Armillaria ostoyae TaxID=47428 RepID=A0A284SDE0_ARMOS|nr:uncharacterized protein ARMOST_22630 [Armillaria ostoyae]
MSLWHAVESRLAPSQLPNDYRPLKHPSIRWWWSVYWQSGLMDITGRSVRGISLPDPGEYLPSRLQASGHLRRELEGFTHDAGELNDKLFIGSQQLAVRLLLHKRYSTRRRIFYHSSFNRNLSSYARTWTRMMVVSGGAQHGESSAKSKVCTTKGSVVTHSPR